MKLRRLAALLLAATGLAQTPRPPAFEVASLKPNPNCRFTGAGGPSPGRLELPCVTLRFMIRAAYGAFKGEQMNARMMEVVGGPAWLDTEQYHLTAKAEGRPPAGVMMGPMLRALLEERFQLKVHTEGRESPVFVLAVVKSGKLVPAKEGSCKEVDWNNLPRPDPAVAMPKYCGMGSMSGSPAGMVAEIPGVTMEEFAGRMLAAQVGRPVIDKTGLSGRFDVRLAFARSLPTGGMLLNGVPTPEGAAPPDGPSIFTALQEQLGLKLSPDRAPVPVIVVDAAAKPTLN